MNQLRGVGGPFEVANGGAALIGRNAVDLERFIAPYDPDTPGSSVSAQVSWAAERPSGIFAGKTSFYVLTVEIDGALHEVTLLQNGLGDMQAAETIMGSVRGF